MNDAAVDAIDQQNVKENTKGIVWAIALKWQAW